MSDYNPCKPTQEEYYNAKGNERAMNASDVMRDLVNVFGDGNIKDFIFLMQNEHRTLQQAFTRLCLMWLECCAHPDYRHDLRNQASHEISHKLLKAFKEKVAEEYACDGVTLDIMSKPSGYMSCI